MNRTATQNTAGRLHVTAPDRRVRFIQARLHLGRPRTEPAILAITPG